MATVERPKATRKPAKKGAALPRVVIEGVTPQVDAGRHAVKRVVGNVVRVEADIYKDGHDLIGARVAYRRAGTRTWHTAPLEYDFNPDRWRGEFVVDAVGAWTFTIEAWADEFATWRDELQKKTAAGQNVNLELLEGAALVSRAVGKANGEPRRALQAAASQLADAGTAVEERVRAGLSDDLLALMVAHFPIEHVTRYERELPIWVDRERAGFAAWYEMFPRSCGSRPGEHATFRDAERRLHELADLGFDVVYLPPIHPIGKTNRKGPNNTLESSPDHPGSPWAIGSPAGGHTAVEPRLGTPAEFDHFVRTANELGMEVALDYALQCSPDHSWLRDHPEWFFIRPDGTLKYAENPPKKYQDIYPMNFWCDDREGLWNACRDVFLFWINHGVKTFRVDNPHTKPLAFWEWVIAEIRAKHPEVVFLSEAFTRPKRMKGLAKLGFTQSYTYFTWRNTAAELRSYLEELTQTEMVEYFRGNLFTNTPDILHEYLQKGGRAAFRVRLMLAATLSPLYGIYSGFELCENVPVRSGSEEYLNSEKYEVRFRDFHAPGNINDDIAAINRIRRENAALQRTDNLTFHRADNDQILFYHKAAPGNHLLVAVNLDPWSAQHTMVNVPLGAIGLGPDQPFEVEDLLTGSRYTWRGERNYVRLDPAMQVGHILRVNA